MEKNLIKVVLIIFLFFSVVNASEVKLNSKRYILYNLNDNEIIDAKGEHEHSNIASLTKIMTVIVAIEHIDDFNKEVTITKEMVSGIAKDVVTVGFKEGDKVTINDLLYGALLRSGADAVNALALLTAPSMSKFIDMMNAKVKELGLEDTHFQNVVGLYDKDNYSSAYDIAQILLYSLNNEKFKTVFTTKEYTLSNGIRVSRSVDYYNRKSKEDLSYIKGAKTGFIEEGGYSLATIATLNDVDYLFVSLNADKSPNQVLDHVKEYKYFSENYSYQDLITTQDKITRLKTKYSREKFVDIYYHQNVEKYLKNDFNKNDLDVVYDGIKEISYFTPKDKEIGYIIIKYNDKNIDNYVVINNSNLTLDYNSLYHDYEYLFKIGEVIFSLMIWGIMSIKYKNQTNFEVDNKEIKS